MKIKIYVTSLFVFFFLTNNVYAEGYMNWDKLTIVSNDLQIPTTIEIEQNRNQISKLKVQISDKNISVPVDQFKNSNDPQFHTMRIGYWNPEVLNFYIAIKCGIHSSFPEQDNPQIIFFIFVNGEYSHTEIYDAMRPLNFSLELNRLANKGRRLKQ